jgi:hypothetical protein
MTPANDFLRVHFIFYDDANLIEAVAVPPIRSTTSPSPVAGTIKGPEQLEDFLVSVGFDGYLVTSGDVLTSTFTATVYDVAPNMIVKALRLPASRPSLLGVQSLVQQHIDVRLVSQSFLGGQGSCPCEVGFR